MYRYIKYSLFLSLLLACSTDKNEKVDETSEIEISKKSKLIGTWRNLSIIVRMPDSTLNVAEGKWEQVLGIKPIITSFNEDSSYVSEYRTIEDSVFMTRAGAWSVKGDSLVMSDGQSANKYHFEVFEDTVIFTGFLDWDQDGMNNDHYAGKQVRYEN